MSGTHYKKLFPKDTLGHWDLEKDVTVTIERVLTEELVLPGGAKESKPVIYFAKAKKKLVLNKTNADIIAKQHGPLIEGWKGKQITLYATMTKFGRETVECIRIRDKARPAPALPDVDDQEGEQ